MTRQDWLPPTFTRHSELLSNVTIFQFITCAFELLVQSFSVSNELFTRQCAQWLILTVSYLLQVVKLGLVGLFSTGASIVATTV